MYSSNAWLKKWMLLWMIICIFTLGFVDYTDATVITLNATHTGSSMEGTNATFATMRADTGDFSSDTIITMDFRATTSASDFDLMRRGMVTYDTSSIPDEATINSIALTAYTDETAKGNNWASAPNITIVDVNPANIADYANGDYDSTTFTRLNYEDLPYASVAAEHGANSWTISNTSYLNKTGSTSYMFMTNWEANNTAPTWASGKIVYIYFDSASSLYPPQLTVDYTDVPGGTYTGTFYAEYDATPIRYYTGTFASMRTGTGYTNSSAPTELLQELDATAVSGYHSSNSRPMITWDTSGLGDGSNIISAIITLYPTSFSNSFSTSRSTCIIDAFPTNQSSFVSADYSQTSLTRSSNCVPDSSFVALNPVNFTLTQEGRNNISKTGKTTFGIESGWMVNNTDPWTSLATGAAAFTSYRYSGGTYKPRLIVTYESSISSPPVVDFTANATTVSTAVQFTDDSTNDPISWNWSYSTDGVNFIKFSDTATRDPIYTFPALGTYSIDLEATNEAGTTNLTKYNYIQVVDYFVGFTQNASYGNPPMTVQFNDTSANSPSTFGWYPWANETSAGSAANATITFTDVGCYDIRHKADALWSNQSDAVCVGYAPIAHFNLTVLS